MSLDRVFIQVLTFSFDPKAKEDEGNFPMPGYVENKPFPAAGIYRLIMYQSIPKQLIPPGQSPGI